MTLCLRWRSAFEGLSHPDAGSPGGGTKWLLTAPNFENDPTWAGITLGRSVRPDLVIGFGPIPTGAAGASVPPIWRRPRVPGNDRSADDDRDEWRRNKFGTDHERTPDGFHPHESSPENWRFGFAVFDETKRGESG